MKRDDETDEFDITTDDFDAMLAESESVEVTPPARYYTQEELNVAVSAAADNGYVLGLKHGRTEA